MKNLLLIASVVCFAGQFSLANNFVLGEKFMNEQLKLSKQKALKGYKKMQKSDESPKCVDFSGNWQGQCRMINPDKEEIKAIQMNVTQKGCSSILFKTKMDTAAPTESEVLVGAVSSASTSALVGVHAMVYSKWSENATTLLQNVKILTNIVFGDVSQVLEIEVPQSTYIENNQLKSKAQGVDLSFDCTLDKVK